MHETDKNSKKKNQREKLKRVRRGTDIERKRIVETKKVPLRWMELCMLFLTESNPFFKVTNDLKIFLPLMIYLLVSRLPSIIHTHTHPDRFARLCSGGSSHTHRQAVTATMAAAMVTSFFVTKHLSPSTHIFFPSHNILPHFSCFSLQTSAKSILRRR